MADVRRLVWTLDTQGGEKIKKAMTDVNKSMDAVSKKMKSVGESMSKIGKGLSVAVTAPLVVAGKKIIDVGSDYEEAVGKIEATMGSMSQSILSWSSRTLETFGVSSVSALQMTGDLGNMATSMGIAQDEAAAMGMRLTELASDLSTFHDKSLDVAQTSLVSIFTGETESLKKFGVVMTEANLKQYALDNGFKENISNMSQAEKVMLRYSFVLDQTASAHGNYARERDNFGASMMALKEATKELGVVLSEELLPMITPIVQRVKDSIIEFTKMDSGMKKTVIKVGLIVAAIGPLLLIGGKLIKGLAMIPTIVSGVGKAFAFLTSPVGLVIGAIIGLIGVMVYLYKTNEDARNRMNKAWESIKDGTMAVVGALQNLWAEYGEGIKANLKIVVDIVKVVWGYMKERLLGLVDIIGAAFSLISNLINGDWSAAWEDAKTIMKGFVDYMLSLPKLFLDIGKSMISNIWEGFKSGALPSVSVGGIGVKMGESYAAKKDGSHRTGKSNIPYDGYMAETHKGEEILSTSDPRNSKNKGMAGMRGMQNVSFSPNITINGSQLSEREQRKATEDALDSAMDIFFRKLKMAWGV